VADLARPSSSVCQVLPRGIASTAPNRRETSVRVCARGSRDTGRIASYDLNLALEAAADQCVAESVGSGAIRPLRVFEFDIRTTVKPRPVLGILAIEPGEDDIAVIVWGLNDCTEGACAGHLVLLKGLSVESKRNEVPLAFGPKSVIRPALLTPHAVVLRRCGMSIVVYVLPIR
jgi:hypothetical protein